MSIIQNIVTKMSSDIEAENIKKSPVDGWYTITKGAYIAYISADGRHLIQGDMYDIETQENLSENIRSTRRFRCKNVGRTLVRILLALDGLTLTKVMIRIPSTDQGL